MRAKTRAMKPAMDLKDLKELYNKWNGAKGRYEMALSMNVDPTHKASYKTHYNALCKELHDALNVLGFNTREEIETALASLQITKPTLTIIQGGKPN